MNGCTVDGDSGDTPGNRGRLHERVTAQVPPAALWRVMGRKKGCTVDTFPRRLPRNAFGWVRPGLAVQIAVWIAPGLRANMPDQTETETSDQV